MERLNCIIVDDEPIARHGMRRLVEMRDELYAVGSASNTKEAERLIASAENGVDLIFLDIDMEGESGLEFARRLRTGQKVIFTTAYADYALDSYEVEAVDYLLKPIRKERFNRSIDRFLEICRKDSSHAEKSSVNHPEGFITVKANRKFVRIALSDIMFVEGLGDYLVIHLPERRITTRMTFKTLSELLPQEAFMRVNKSYIVSRSRIESFSTSEIKIGETVIPIGSTYRDTVIRQLRGAQA